MSLASYVTLHKLLNLIETKGRIEYHKIFKCDYWPNIASYNFISKELKNQDEIIPIKTCKKLVTVFQLKLNIFILDPIVLLPGLQSVTTLLPSIDEIPLDCLLALVSIKQINWYPISNHYGLACYIFTWNRYIFVFELLYVEFLSYMKLSFGLSHHWIWIKMITSRVMIHNHFKLSTHKWKVLNLTT